MNYYHIIITDVIFSGKLHHVERQINRYNVGNGSPNGTIEITSFYSMSRLEVESYLRSFYAIYDGSIIYNL